MQTATRLRRDKLRSDKPATEVFIVDGSPSAALAVSAHRPSQESTYVLSRAAHERSAEFNQRVLRRAARILARERIGSLWYVLGAPLEPQSSVQLLAQLLPLLDGGCNVTLAAPRRHGRIVFSWIDELLGKGSADVKMGVRFYADAAPSQLRRSAPAPLQRESSLQCA